MECVWGQAICLLIDPTRQERALQDDLRDTAMVHLCTSAKWAVKAELPSMVLVAAQQVWNAGETFRFFCFFVFFVFFALFIDPLTDKVQPLSR